jgi:hypothetical protein
MNTRADKFDTTPDPNFLRALQNQSWTVSGALSELVDNSFGSGRGNATHVEIIYEKQARIITVLDNGQGMDAIGRLFQLGNTIGRAVGDIGEYGSGGTMALLWLGPKVRIWTLCNGMVNADTVDWNWQRAMHEYPQVSNKWEKATLANTPEMLLDMRHGTMIRVQISGKRHLHIGNIQRDLAQTYAPAIRDGKRLIWRQQGERTELSDTLEMPDDPEKMVDFEVQINRPGEGPLIAHGKIGLVEDLPYSS